ncbi:RDD family protein [Bdellovibrio svalbardensis]|uniref:RDD family protein n=1 Tax=Bdellovibrio svalbardensis TaxID=2972972 RepID=A0ABT6DJ85_9BACT|nr:RDD family protein [Bdellovibrio svalbardensis]MDG0816564.1 RDD family protein [Bdellovibrio svalbardensis]
MFEINKDKQKIIPQRAPHNREAPLPLKNPVVRRRKPTRQPTDSKLNEIFKNNKMQFDQNTGFHGGPSARRKGYRLALWSWLASTIDALILVAASCVFLLVFSLIVKSSMGGILAGITQGQHRLLLFAEVYAMSSWIYMISIRSLMGSSIGEWACDLRLGQPHERLQANYVLRVFLRSTLIVLTGVITMPILSLVFGKDIAGVCSGLRLFSLK